MVNALLLVRTKQCVNVKTDILVLSVKIDLSVKKFVKREVFLTLVVDPIYKGWLLLVVSELVDVSILKRAITTHTMDFVHTRPTPTRFYFPHRLLLYHLL